VHNPILKLLDHYCGVRYHPIHCTEGQNRFTVKGIAELEFTAIALKSKAPPYSPNRQLGKEGDTIAVQIYDPNTQKRLLYAPGLGSFESHLEAYFASSDCLLVDGTFWHEDEMQRQGVGKKLASDMGHLHLAGKGGMIEILDGFPDKRKVLIHINNTNPILNDKSEERRQLESHNIEVAYDGMEIKL
jgi:pyrroloquinoline quinone biosynthesis protein B